MRPTGEHRKTRFARLIQCHSITALALDVCGIGWPLLTPPTIADPPTAPFLASS